MRIAMNENLPIPSPGRTTIRNLLEHKVRYKRATELTHDLGDIASNTAELEGDIWSLTAVYVDQLSADLNEKGYVSFFFVFPPRLRMSAAKCKKLVLDAGPLLSLSPLRGLADTFYTVPQVLSELKDARAREHFKRLGLMSGAEIQVRSPDPVSLSHGT